MWENHRNRGSDNLTDKCGGKRGHTLHFQNGMFYSRSTAQTMVIHLSTELITTTIQSTIFKFIVLEEKRIGGLRVSGSVDRSPLCEAHLR
jgi:hypothetical protein